MHSYCVIPGWDSTRTRWLKEQSHSSIHFWCFAHCAGSWLSVPFCLCYQYHIVERPKEQWGKKNLSNHYSDCWALAEECTCLYIIYALCHISFPLRLRQCLVCFHLPLYFFFYPLACLELYRASSEEMFSHSRSPNCYTSHPSSKTHCGVLSHSQQDRNEHGHTQSILDGTENLHLAPSHCGPHIQDWPNSPLLFFWAVQTWD